MPHQVNMINNSKLVHKGPVLDLFVSRLFALMPLTYLHHLTLYPLIFSIMFFGWFISIYLSFFSPPSGNTILDLCLFYLCPPYPGTKLGIKHNLCVFDNGPEKCTETTNNPLVWLKFCINLIHSHQHPKT